MLLFTPILHAEPLRGDSLLLITMSPGNLGAHLIDLRRKG